MKASLLATVLTLACAALALFPLAPVAAAAFPAASPALSLGASPTAASNTTPLAGNVSGPALVATSSNATFYLNASGGPASVAGVFKGEINWTANVSAANTTGSSVTPTSGTISNVTKQPVSLVVTTGPVAEPLTVVVKVTSSLGKVNSTANFTRTFRIVVPYLVRATLVAGPSAGVLPFNVTVALDGTTVGSVAVPKLAPNATYALQFRYATGGLSSGYHTFTLTVEDVHGLVTFGNGRTVLSSTFYVAPAAANNTVWYVLGIVAFFGVLFIYATRAAARRRTPGRR